MVPKLDLGLRGNKHDLPKSNHGKERAIPSLNIGEERPSAARAIPDGAKESHWIAPDHFPIRRIDWKISQDAARGSILFLAGRGDAYEKYIETLDYWASEGWYVTALDWRGQGGSGRLGHDRVTGHVSDFSVWTDDLQHFWQEWVRQVPGPHVLAGHSMGGHLVLRAAAEQLLQPDALILSAPMLGLGPKRVPVGILHGVARIMAWAGDSTRPAWHWSERPGEVPADRITLLTHDDGRYADELWWRSRRSELAMGPGSWGWIERAYASIRLLNRPGVLERVSVPVLMIGTRADRLVSFDAIERAAHRLPLCETLFFGSEARHEILRETDAIRNRALHAIDAFLDRVAPRAKAPSAESFPAESSE